MWCRCHRRRRLLGHGGGFARCEARAWCEALGGQADAARELADEVAKALCRARELTRSVLSRARELMLEPGRVELQRRHSHAQPADAALGWLRVERPEEARFLVKNVLVLRASLGENAARRVENVACRVVHKAAAGRVPLKPVQRDRSVDGKRAGHRAARQFERIREGATPTDLGRGSLHGEVCG